MTLAKYVLGDSRNLSTILERNGVSGCDLVITSPPYFDTKNYANVSGQIGHKQSYEAFLDDVTQVLQQCYDATSARGTLWLVMDTVRRNGRVMPLPFEIEAHLRRRFHKATWILRDIIIWDKGKNVPWHDKGRLKKQYEYVLFFTKSDRFQYNVDALREVADYKQWWLQFPERYNGNGMPPSNLWSFSSPLRGWGNGLQKHLCPLPFPLIERIISLCSDEGDTVLDPFAGSGSVIALAKEMGRNAIGLDICADYKKTYHSEVRPGAIRYWKTRSKEIENMQSNIAAFRRINQQLRKIKACVRLSGDLFERLRVPFQPVLIDGRSATLYLCGNGKLETPTASREIERALGNVKQECKINLRVVVSSGSNGHLPWRTKKTLFVYDLERIYRYSKRANKPDFAPKQVGRPVLLSNIGLQLSKQTPFGP